MDFILVSGMVTSLGAFYFWLKHRSDVERIQSEVELARIEAFRDEALSELRLKRLEAGEVFSKPDDPRPPEPNA